MNHDESKKTIANVFDKEQTSYQVLLTIPGKFIIANGIQKEWAEARGIDPKLINYDFEDNITLFQAKLLGVLDFVTAINSTTAYSEQNEFLGLTDDEPNERYNNEKTK